MAWRPEPGDTITGKMVDVALIDPNGQGQYPCVTLEEVDGERRAIHAFHSVLQKEIARRRPKIGDELTITYQGKKEGVNREYHSYKVLGGQGNQVNWDSFLPPDERQASSEPPIPSSAGASDAPGISAGAPADMGPLPPKPPAPKGEQFGDEVPF